MEHSLGEKTNSQDLCDIGTVALYPGGGGTTSSAEANVTAFSPRLASTKIFKKVVTRDFCVVAQK